VRKECVRKECARESVREECEEGGCEPTLMWSEKKFPGDSCRNTWEHILLYSSGKYAPRYRDSQAGVYREILFPVLQAWHVTQAGERHSNAG